MTDVVDLSQYRKRRRDDMDRGNPQVVLNLWFDEKREVIECSSLMTLNDIDVDTFKGREFIVSSLFHGASRTAKAFAEEDTPDAWKTEPVFHVLGTRAGWLVSMPNEFWSCEADASPGHRLRCARWAARVAIKASLVILARCWQLAFNPKSLRSLET
jgi:hypothetical protein